VVLTYGKLSRGGLASPGAYVQPGPLPSPLQQVTRALTYRGTLLTLAGYPKGPGSGALSVLGISDLRSHSQAPAGRNQTTPREGRHHAKHG
jgi:hypothetical protein